MSTIGICSFTPALATTIEVARAADEAGLDSTWTGEFNDRSAIVALAEMAHHTSNCRIGSAIAYAVGRSPLILANEARGLDEISGGRLVLGIGTGTKGMQKGWHGERDPDSPASRLEELVPLLRRIWRLHEGPVRHEGRFYSMNLTATAEVLPPTRERIPVFTAAVNARMIETAGRVLARREVVAGQTQDRGRRSSREPREVGLSLLAERADPLASLVALEEQF